MPLMHELVFPWFVDPFPTYLEVLWWSHCQAVLRHHHTHNQITGLCVSFPLSFPELLTVSDSGLISHRARNISAICSPDLSATPTFNQPKRETDKVKRPCRKCYTVNHSDWGSELKQTKKFKASAKSTYVKTWHRNMTKKQYLKLTSRLTHV